MEMRSSLRTWRREKPERSRQQVDAERALALAALDPSRVTRIPTPEQPRDEDWIPKPKPPKPPRKRRKRRDDGTYSSEVAQQ